MTPLILLPGMACDAALWQPLQAELVAALRIPVVAAGGVTTIEDVLSLRDTGAAGAVAGTAIYTGKLSVSDTLQALGDR